MWPMISLIVLGNETPRNTLGMKLSGASWLMSHWHGGGEGQGGVWPEAPRQRTRKLCPPSQAPPMGTFIVKWISSVALSWILWVLLANYWTWEGPGNPVFTDTSLARSTDQKCGWPADPKVPLVCEVRTGLWRPELSPCVSGAVAKWLASALGCGAPSLGGNRCNLYFHS